MPVQYSTVQYSTNSTVQYSTDGTVRAIPDTMQTHNAAIIAHTGRRNAVKCSPHLIFLNLCS